MPIQPIGRVHTLIITTDGTVLETDGDAEFDYTPATGRDDAYLELHLEVDFGALGQTLTMNLPVPSIVALGLLIQDLQPQGAATQNIARLRLIEP